MKASELIIKLQNIISETNDLDVYFWDNIHEYRYVEFVNVVSEFGAEPKIILTDIVAGARA